MRILAERETVLHQQKKFGAIVLEMAYTKKVGLQLLIKSPRDSLLENQI